MIQFGIDQLQFAPSQQLSSFVYWVLYMNYSLLAFIFLTASIITAIVYTNAIYFTFICIFGYNALIIIIAVLFFCCCKRRLVIEPAQHNNPIKLIWRVMRYALTHKQPVRRSAFTYGEFPPSRLDLGKERYGGPFTTTQVEDVKSFFYILSVVIGTLGYGFFNTKSTISDHYIFLMKIDGPKVFIENFLLRYPLAVSYLVIVFVVPFYQFIIVPL